MGKFIGRKINIGVGKESVRGTPVAPTHWYPKMELTVDDMIEQVVNESSVGVIEDAEGANVTMKMSEGSLKGRVNNESFGLWLLAVLGSENAPVVAGGESIVYDHEFVVGQNAQHPSVTIGVDDENGDVQYPLGMAESLELNVEVGLYAEYTLDFRSNKSETASLTPSYPTTENIFLPQHGEFKLADDLAGLDAADAIDIKKVVLTIIKNTENDQVVGNVDPIDRLNKQFVIEGSVELLYENRDNIGILVGDTAKALRIKLVNTNVTLGTASNPQLQIDLAKVKLSEVGRDLSNNELIKQTLTFKAFYSLSDAKSIVVTLRNLQSSAY